MKILLCHNYYQQPGGEDQVFADEGELLENHGHQVIRYTRHNDDIHQMGRIAVARKTVYNHQTYHELSELIQRDRPELMHCTNTFPLISPAAYDAAASANIAVVQSLHNYRLFCANALFLREGRVCEDCLGKQVPWPAVAHACYRDSRAASAVVVGLQMVNRWRGTWTRRVDRFIALTHFARERYVQGGLPPERIVVKPNFLHTDPGVGTGQGGYAVFVGRLSAEKGIDTLIEAWQKLQHRLPLKVIGDGPLAERIRQVRGTKIEWLGRRPLAEVLSIVGEATMLVMPSVWYETFGRTIIEAYAKGTPVLASNLGAMKELVVEGQTGMLFAPGNAAELTARAEELLSSPERLIAMRQACRAEYESKYTASINHDLLMAVYTEALAAHGANKQHL